MKYLITIVRTTVLSVSHANSGRLGNIGLALGSTPHVAKGMVNNLTSQERAYNLGLELANEDLPEQLSSDTLLLSIEGNYKKGILIFSYQISQLLVDSYTQDPLLFQTVLYDKLCSNVTKKARRDFNRLNTKRIMFNYYNSDHLIFSVEGYCILN